MQFHTISRQHPRKRSAQVGRGGKRGKTAGRGTKGQNARAGRKKRPELRDFIKKIPKLRGYRFHSIRQKPFSVALRVVERRFKAGDAISPASLAERGLIPPFSGTTPPVKIIGDKVSIRLTITGCTSSVSAKKAIEAAGGTIQ